tara:strand:- start:1225 stop:1614 length:390 start_codon:yes stop_codon:yes gene_type:complete
MKKAQSLLYHLKDNPMRYTEMQKFLWKWNNQCTSIETKCSRGYWCTNITQLIHITKVIEKGTDGKYRITKMGLKNIDNPFSKGIDYWKNRAINSGIGSRNAHIDNWRLQRHIDKLERKIEELYVISKSI